MKPGKLLAVAAVTALFLLSCAKNGLSVNYTAYTVPKCEGLETSCNVARKGNEWDLTVSVLNSSSCTQTFKLALAAEPGFKIGRAHV